MNAIDVEWTKCTPEMGGLYQHPEGLLVRDRGDVGVILEQKQWRPLLQYGTEGAVLLDLGGHIGAATRWFLTRANCSRIVAVEPNPSSADVYMRNHGADPRVTLLRAACVEKADGPLPLYLGKTYPACSSLQHFRGRESVQTNTVAFRELLSEHKPSIIKCDVEGGEYGWSWADLPEHVTEVAMELHQNKPEWLDGQLKVDNQLLACGFKHVKAPRHKKLFVPAQIAIWSRRSAEAWS